MSWAVEHINKLKCGKVVEFKPNGSSMEPIIHSGDSCTVEPCEQQYLHEGDIVLCSVKGNQYLHIIKSIKNGMYQIGNNKGKNNGWIKFDNIYGKLTKVTP